MHGQEFFRSVAGHAPFSQWPPSVVRFFRDYLRHEKTVEFAGRRMINTHFPPWPSAAFDRMARRMGELGRSAGEGGGLYSVTLAVTNRCQYRCWHCYNAGRDTADMPLETWRSIAAQLVEQGATVVTLGGGEPLLRADLEEIAAAFGGRCFLKLNTTGDGLSAARARTLAQAGLFAAGISLDSADEREHDAMRGRPGAFATALSALRHAAEGGLYPYIVAVANPGLVEERAFARFMQFAAEAGALEVHLLEPCPAGRLAGRRDVALGAEDKARILRLQAEAARRADWPILSTFLYLEAPENFGCGAGLTHLYIDGTGQVCPCNLVPLSFGDVSREPLRAALGRMGEHFRQPRTECAGQALAAPAFERLRGRRPPLPLEESSALCHAHLPAKHATPRFYRIAAGDGRIGPEELRKAYDRVHDDYEAHWLSQAARPVEELARRLEIGGEARIFEAGCGTGFGTQLLARRLGPGGSLLACDLSEGMLSVARERLRGAGAGARIEFRAIDALEALSRPEARESFDCVFSSWVLGYIPLRPFFEAAERALRPGGALAFVVHRLDSPREPLELFGALAAEEPEMLEKQTAFDFPKDLAHARLELERAGLRLEWGAEDSIVFRCESARGALDHLLKSGAGTAYYDAVRAERRAALEEEFVARLQALHPDGPVEVRHDYVCAVARKGIAPGM